MFLSLKFCSYCTCTKKRGCSRKRNNPLLSRIFHNINELSLCECSGKDCFIPWNLGNQGWAVKIRRRQRQKISTETMNMVFVLDTFAWGGTLGISGFINLLKWWLLSFRCQSLLCYCSSQLHSDLVINDVKCKMFCFLCFFIVLQLHRPLHMDSKRKLSKILHRRMCFY